MRQVQEVQRAPRAAYRFAGHMQITCGRGDRRVSHEDLNGPQINAGFEQMGAEAMTQDVDVVAFADAGFGLSPGEGIPNRTFAHRLARVQAWKQPRPGSSNL